jgi:hypothetical protein
MAKRKNAATKKVGKPDILHGWGNISDFLGEPVSVVQRWASEGMPVHKEGRLVSTTVEEVETWLGKDSGKPLRTVTEETDLTAELKRGLAYVRGKKG